MLSLQNCPHPTLAPLASDPSSLRFGAANWHDFLRSRLAGLDCVWRDDRFPSGEFLARMRSAAGFRVLDPDGTVIGSGDGPCPVELEFDGVSLIHPWDLLAVSEMFLDELSENHICGEIHPAAVIDGTIELGENSRILPGVYIEGNCVIGRDCKIGPNCYLRGRTVIGDRCHIGQAVEIKNSIIGSRTSIGHLSYVGDSVIGERVNFGAGTIIANLRHDGRNHRSLIDGTLTDTGRRKFGAIVGDDVHTGIHTAIYPGRKLFPGSSTSPGEIVRHDLR